jgi:UTP--glucose-1-phosphate uridylyltransferase
MGDHTLYLPGVLMHWAREGRDTLHHKSTSCPKALLFGYTRAAPPPLAEHPAFIKPQDEMNSSSPASPDAFLQPIDDVASAPLTPLPVPAEPTLRDIATLIDHEQAFENTSTSVAASQMRNALNNLADTVQDPDEKKVGALCTYYMDSC